MRDTGRHAPAAYCASVWACRDLCKSIDAKYDLGGSEGGGVGGDGPWSTRLCHRLLLSLIRRQFCINYCLGLLDEAAKQELIRSNQGEGSYQAHLALVGLTSSLNSFGWLSPEG